MDLRRARAADVPAIVELVNRVSATSPASVAEAPEDGAVWAATFARDHDLHPWLVAVEGDEFSGFAKAAPYGARDGYRWSVEVSIYLRPEVHGRGLGKLLYARLFEVLEAQGYRHVWAKITTPNPASERLHTRLGLRLVGVQRGFAWKHGQWHDIGLWQGSLGAASGPPGRVLGVGEVLD